MAKKKTPLEEGSKKVNNPNVMGLRAAVVEQPITATLEENYMPYAMSVIVSRAIPEIDGFKPSHRKLLYTMYKMGLLTGARTKSANIVGQTMRLNPHGDRPIYDTMVRLSKGYGALLHPFVDSKGNFGKVYSRDMAWAASRYTEAKLAPICAELFRDLDQDAVDFVDNYDNTMKEPALLPTTFPNILVSANQGIAVGMASQLCGFNLSEVCDTTVAYLKNPDCDIAATLLAPDFPTGGQVVLEGSGLEEVYRTGRGSVKLRGRYRSRSMEHVVEEARALAERGVKELIVIAQDITRYGTDWDGRPHLADLLEELVKLPFRWIRLHYLYPEMIDDHLIDVIAREEKIVKYLDIPLQHCNDGILRRMNRRGDKADIEELLDKLRERIPGLVLRNSLITGLPGAGAGEVVELCECLWAPRQTRAGVFPYSPEEGTPAAKMERVDTEEAIRRAELVVDIQSRIMDEWNEEVQGEVLEVLCEGFDGQSMSYVGRSYADSPDVDGHIYFTAEEPVEAGTFARVRITGTMDGDLTGELVEET